MKKIKNHRRINIYGGKHLTVSKHTALKNYPLHWHSYFELEIILSGEGKYVINDIEYDVSSTKVFLLSTTDFHRVEVSKTIKLINIAFDEEMVDEKNLLSLVFSNTERAYSLLQDEYERLLKAAELLAYECKTDGDCQRQLLQYILTCLFRKSSTLCTDAFNGDHNHAIRNAIAYMQIHFKENITLQKLASEAGYHPAYFSELFKKYTSKTYTCALNELRIGYARTLLANGFSVSDACFLSGFTSLSNFGKVFKKNCHISPREYAKTSQK